MRIVGGNHKGARLATPATRAVRPTSDRTREALFNILAHGIEGFELGGVRVLDLFAGTGALGLEALSRGAKYGLFIEDAADARALIRRNIETLGLTGATKVWRRDATRLGDAGTLAPFGLAFADPPYGKGLGERALASAMAGGWMEDDAIAVLEDTADEEIGEIAGLDRIDMRIYGETRILIYRRRSAV